MQFTAAGRLNQLMTIQQRTRTQSASGEIMPQWVDAMEVWGEIKPLRGRNVEIAAARTKGRATSHQITIRYPGITLTPDTTRIVYRGRFFELFDIDDVLERRVELDILANEATA